MSLHSNATAFWRHHLCEVILFTLLAIPVVAVRPSLLNVGLIVILAGTLFTIGYLTDMATTFRLDQDGIHYLPGGHRRVFLAWNEIGEIIPRSFRGWPAENAFVVVDHSRRPLLVASVSMFTEADARRALDYATQFAPVSEPVKLSPFTAKAEGVSRPDLVPERTSERFLASSVGGLLTACAIAAVLFVFIEL